MASPAHRREYIRAVAGTLFLVALWAATGCRIALPSPPIDRWPTQFTDANVGYVRIFFATDRNDTSDLNDATPPVRDRFGILPQRGLTYGVATVSIPPGHVKGRTESPALFAAPNPARHLSITDLKVLARASEPASVAAYFESMKARLRGPPPAATTPATAPPGARPEVLIFIHGFATRFDDAIVNAAQVAHDIGFEGLVVCYSWTSAGAILSYLADGKNAEWTVRYFAEFLEQLADHGVADRIHLLAHSMGSRVVTRGLLAYMALRDHQVVQDLIHANDSPAGGASERHDFGQVILAAADVDAAIFARDYAPLLWRAADRTTVYISQRDFALLVSGRLHDFSRLGNSDLPDVDLRLHERIDVVDATPVDRDPIGHFYFAESPEVLDDIRDVLAERSTRERELRRQFLYVIPELRPTSGDRARPLDAFDWQAP
jgi:esterase/lipase superfamily enzyme